MAVNRFASRNTPKLKPLRDLIVSVSLFVLVLGMFLWGMSGITQSTEEEKLRAMESAVTKAVVQCYAVEGHYPVSVDYLEEHYGLSVDRERYLIHYEAIADNIMPLVMVIPL